MNVYGVAAAIKHTKTIFLAIGGERCASLYAETPEKIASAGVVIKASAMINGLNAAR